MISTSYAREAGNQDWGPDQREQALEYKSQQRTMIPSKYGSVRLKHSIFGRIHGDNWQNVTFNIIIAESDTLKFAICLI